MYFLALAADFDGTIAHDGAVDAATLAALTRLRRSGRKLILVTGRRLDSLQRAFPECDQFDRLVVENGAVVFDPTKHEETLAAPPPPQALVDRLLERGVSPLHVGRSIVATWHPQEKVVLEEINRLGLELQIVFNKGAVMVLAPGINKASGLGVALRDLGISSRNVVAVGDAENDHAMLAAAGCSAAVANALPAVQASADIRLRGVHGAGVTELIDRIIAEDAALATSRNGLRIGVDASEHAALAQPGLGNVLVAGQSGVGKSTLATALTERMVEGGFTFCVFDPEGDYGELANSVCIGDAKSPPILDEALAVIRELKGNVVVNTQALSLADRPGCFNQLAPRLLGLRAHSGRPHWIVVDEAHHVLDAGREDFDDLIPRKTGGIVFVTVHPEAMARQALETVSTIVALGVRAHETISNYCRAVGIEAPTVVPAPSDNEVVFWNRTSDSPPIIVRAIAPIQKRERHKTKYAEGELDPGTSFYFRGSQKKLNLRAQNLMTFISIGEGVDVETWQHHRRNGDYSNWFRMVIKDEQLAEAAKGIEQDGSIGPIESRTRIMDAIRNRYTASSKGPQDSRG